MTLETINCIFTQQKHVLVVNCIEDEVAMHWLDYIRVILLIFTHLEHVKGRAKHKGCHD